MSRSLFLLLALSAIPAVAGAQSTVDTAGAGALIAQAMDHSEVMANLRELSDVIGPRLSGSAAMRRANEWTAERFRAYGLRATLEPYTFGVTWERGPVSIRLVAPFTRAVTAHSWAWTAGTGGKTLTGPVVLADLSTPDSLAAYKRRVRGAWVLPRAAYPLWNPDGPPMTPADSASRAEALRLRGLATSDTSAAAVLARRQFALDLPYVLRAGRRPRDPRGRVEGARPHDHERLAQPSLALAQPRARARGLRDARTAGRGRRRSPPGRPGGKRGRPLTGATVEYRGGDRRPSGRGRS